MVNFKKEDLLKLAKLSAIKLDDEDIDSFAKQLKVLLEYAMQIELAPVRDQVETVSKKPTLKLEEPSNVYREDKVISQIDPSLLLDIAPKTQDNYFVVPKIL